MAQNPAATPTVVLHQFPFSHFNEKARWALDWKGIQHRRKSYLPGPHARAIQKLSGQSATPVLEIDGRTTAGSARIIALLEESFRHCRALYPTHPEERKEALEIEQHFDRTVGPAVRTALFSVLVPEAGYITRMFGQPQPLPARFIYRLVFPIARSRVEKAYRTNDREHVSACCAEVERALDFVAERTRSTGFVVGDQFSVADLTCAALLAPIGNPDHPDMKRPEPMPEPVLRFLEIYQEHDAIAWLRNCYLEARPLDHRPTSCAT